MKKGTSLPIKKVLGGAVGLIGIGMVFGIDQINQIVQKSPMIVGFLLLLISYFLIISGRRI